MTIPLISFMPQSFILILAFQLFRSLSCLAPKHKNAISGPHAQPRKLGTPPKLDRGVQ